MYRLWLAALAGFAIACGPSFRDLVRAPPEPICDGELGGSGIVAKLRRGGCLGHCPNYRVVLCGDGVVVYDGVQFVKTPGRRVRRLPPDALRDLTAKLDAASDGPSPLDEPVANDGPSFYLMHVRDGGIRWIPPGAPAVEAFERATFTIEWVGTPEERDRLSDESR